VAEAQVNEAPLGVGTGQFRTAAGTEQARARRFDGAQGFFYGLQISRWDHAAGKESFARVKSVPVSTKDFAGRSHRESWERLVTLFGLSLPKGLRLSAHRLLRCVFIPAFRLRLARSESS